MKITTHIFLLLLLVLCSCGGGSESGSSVIVPPDTLPTEGTRPNESNSIEVDSKEMEEVRDVLIIYSTKWNEVKDHEVNKGVLVGMLLSKLGFKELSISDARFIYDELEKSKNDYTETAKQLVIRRSK